MLCLGGTNESNTVENNAEDYGIVNKGTFSGGFQQEIIGCGHLNFVNEDGGEVTGKVVQNIKDCENTINGNLTNPMSSVVVKVKR